jgi:hypothetical protein
MYGIAYCGELLVSLLAIHYASGSKQLPTFSTPRLVSAPVECFLIAHPNITCGYVPNAECKCPELPGAADSYYGLTSDARHMMGIYTRTGLSSNQITYTIDGGESWNLKLFSGPPASYAWNLYPVEHGRARRTFGGISVGVYNNRSLGSKTDRSWSGKQSATFSVDSAGELQMKVTGGVTVGPLPWPVNNTNGIRGMPFPPQFYGGPIRLHDGSLLGTIGVFWSKDDPLSPTDDGPEHRMSIVAIRSVDFYTWHFAGVVANASGPGGYPSTTFGPSENDLALLEDGQTLVCVVRMDGDGNCDTQTYRYYSLFYSYDDGASWSRAVNMTGAGCVWPRLLKLDSGPLIMSGARLCVENSSDVFIWVNADGMAGKSTGGPGNWTKYSVSYWHNKLWSGPTTASKNGTNYSYLFDAKINSSTSFESSGFTSLIPAGPNEFVLVYQKYLNPDVWPPFPQATFQMKISMPPRHIVPAGPTSSHPPLWVWVVSGIAGCIIALIAYSMLRSKSALGQNEYYTLTRDESVLNQSSPDPENGGAHLRQEPKTRTI